MGLRASTRRCRLRGAPRADAGDLDARQAHPQAVRAREKGHPKRRIDRSQRCLERKQHQPRGGRPRMRVSRQGRHRARGLAAGPGHAGGAHHGARAPHGERVPDGLGPCLIWRLLELHADHNTHAEKDERRRVGAPHRAREEGAEGNGEHEADADHRPGPAAAHSRGRYPQARRGEHHGHCEESERRAAWAVAKLLEESHWQHGDHEVGGEARGKGRRRVGDEVRGPERRGEAPEARQGGHLVPAVSVCAASRGQRCEQRHDARDDARARPADVRVGRADHDAPHSVGPHDEECEALQALVQRFRGKRAHNEGEAGHSRLAGARQEASGEHEPGSGGKRREKEEDAVAAQGKQQRAPLPEAVRHATPEDVA
mmetsp:Transcript_6160/g.21080  ORF Transcript_6160/g.21080 Transcript_6160/m.21080 type:complete len:371 (+) Transcript_6160:514-1626(+)